MALKPFYTTYLNLNSKPKKNRGFGVFPDTFFKVKVRCGCTENYTKNQKSPKIKSLLGYHRRLMDKFLQIKPRRSSGWQLLYKSGDLFTCPPTDALAHCISEDCHMGAGIALLFKKKFKGVDELLAQKKQPGQCAALRRSGRFVYYLVTKKKYFQKPTSDSLRKSLVSMKKHCLTNGITSISMPRIGCGLDKMKWQNVSSIITDVFEDTKISITVYSL